MLSRGIGVRLGAPELESVVQSGHCLWITPTASHGMKRCPNNEKKKVTGKITRKDKRDPKQKEGTADAFPVLRGGLPAGTALTNEQAALIRGPQAMRALHPGVSAMTLGTSPYSSIWPPAWKIQKFERFKLFGVMRPPRGHFERADAGTPPAAYWCRMRLRARENGPWQHPPPSLFMGNIRDEHTQWAGYPGSPATKQPPWSWLRDFRA